MTLKHLVVSAITALCVAAPAAHAQVAKKDVEKTDVEKTDVEKQVAKDPAKLSGTWTGYIGRSEATPTPVKVDFKFAPDGALSGKISGQQITTGTIDVGKYDVGTGTLKFTVTLRDTMNSQGGSVTFDGKIAPDVNANNVPTASGKLLLNGETGVFKFVHAIAFPQVLPVVRLDTKVERAANLPDLKRGFTQTYAWVARAAELVPADKYSYKPVGTVRTFGQQVAHIADGARYYCGRGAGKNVEWTDATEKSATTKAAIVDALKKAVAECGGAYDSGTQVGPLVENLTHASLHYGNIVTYMRMLGLTPPSS